MLTGTYAPGDGLGVPVALIDRGRYFPQPCGDKE